MPTVIPREPRLPLFVRVRTQPPLPECWSVNISRSGIGLIAQGGHDAQASSEGREIDLEFELPGEGSVAARGAIMWWNPEPAPQPGLTWMALGIRFTGVEATDQVSLRRYVESYRFRVVVALADDRQRALARDVLAAEFDVHFADSPSDVAQLLARGDVAACVVCGDHPAAVRMALEQVVVGALPKRRWPGDLAPRVVTWGSLPADEVVGLFNRGLLFHALAADTGGAQLQSAVADACRDHGVRTEERRATLALERALQRDRARLRAPERWTSALVDEGVFASRPMQDLVAVVQRVASHPVNILLQGETGTGKEVVARIIHELSDRADGPLVVQDCGALNEPLLDSELFGHVKGAFTGAVADHVGQFVLADGGTIFLDEIQNMTPSLQAKLLRVIETGDVRPVGAAHGRRVDVRIIGASNRDLGQEVEAGRIRADLYYRLNTFRIDVPSLRERAADILPLAYHLLRRACNKSGRPTPKLTSGAEQALVSYTWPGNVRELRNVIERALILTDMGDDIDTAALAVTAGGRRTTVVEPGPSLTDSVSAYEREVIRSALARNHEVIRRAARELHVSAVTLGRKVKRHGLHDQKG